MDLGFVLRFADRTLTRTTTIPDPKVNLKRAIENSVRKEGKGERKLAKEIMCKKYSSIMLKHGRLILTCYDCETRQTPMYTLWIFSKKSHFSVAFLGDKQEALKSFLSWVHFSNFSNGRSIFAINLEYIHCH